MFYLKHKGERLYIDDTNVFTTCPKCGKEVRVNIQDVLSDGVSDLYGTAVYCQDCGKLLRQNSRSC